MSSPQLTDAHTPGEWFPTVAEAGSGARPRSPSHAAIPTDVRRRRFVRLVTITMAGLVAFTLLGVASFAWRRQAMQAALEAPPVATPAVPVVAPAVTPAAPSPIEAQPSAAVIALAATPATPATPKAISTAVATAAKPVKKTAKRSPFLSSIKAPAKSSR